MLLSKVCFYEREFTGPSDFLMVSNYCRFTLCIFDSSFLFKRDWKGVLFHCENKEKLKVSIPILASKLY